MKLSYCFILALLLGVNPLLAQQISVETASPEDSAAFRSSPRLNELLSEKPDSEHAKLNVGKHFQVSGPLAEPFKSKKTTRSFPRRLLHWINPFAPSEQREQQVLRSSDYDPRPWRDVAGWSSGGPWTPNEATHEGGFTLMSVSRRGE
jgi:hypothetical protein